MNRTLRSIERLAGLLEGEGCFGDFRSCGLRIRLVMTDRDVVEWAKRVLGATSISTSARGGNRKVAYRTQVAGRMAAGWMMTLYPLLGERRRQRIREALASWRGRHQYRNPYGVPSQIDGRRNLEYHRQYYRNPALARKVAA